MQIIDGPGDGTWEVAISDPGRNRAITCRLRFPWDELRSPFFPGKPQDALRRF